MKKIFFLAAVALMSTAMFATDPVVADFENAAYEGTGIWTTDEAPYWYGWGTSEENTWISGDYQFVTYNDDSWGTSYYYEFVVSRDKSNVYTDFMHAYRSAAGGAYEGDNFAVWYNNWYGNNPIEPFVKTAISGCFICNCAYTVNSMCNGDGYAKKFTKESYFRVLFIGSTKNAENDEYTVTDTVVVALAENGTYIDKWTFVDLSPLGEVDKVDIALQVSDYGTPTYFCLDNFGAAKPDGYIEPARAKFDLAAGFENEEGGIQIDAEHPVWRGVEVEEEEELLWTSGSYTFTTYVDDWGTSGKYYYDVTASNLKSTTFDFSAPYYDQYAAAGKAAQGDNYAVWYESWYGNANVVFDQPHVISGMAVTNNTWVVNAILNGDGMSEEEGGKGLPFHAGDYYKLIITGYLDGEKVENTVEFYLADFRATEQGEKWKYAENWQWVDLTSLGMVDEIGFAVEGSKHNTYGLTTPKYFCFDNFGGAKAECELGEMTAIDVVPTAISNTEANTEVNKMVRDGQVVIVRDGKTFNVLGAEL